MSTSLFATPDIRKLEARVAVLDQAQRAIRNTRTDTPVGIATLHEGTYADAVTVVITEQGYVYSRTARTSDWQEQPPIPGTAARRHYDERKALTDEIGRQRAAIGQTPEPSDD